MNGRMLVESLWVLVTRLANRGSNFLVFLLLARSLPVADFGLYGYVVATTMVVSVACDLGLRQAAAQQIGRGGANAAAVTSLLLLLWLPLGLAAGLGAAVSLHWGDFSLTTGTLALVAGSTAAMLLIRMGQGVFLGQGAIRALNQSELVSRVVMLNGTIALWLLGRLDLVAALWLLLLAHAAAGLWLVIQLRGLLTLALPEGALIRRMLRAGIAFASGILLMILMGRVGIWVVNAKLPADSLGIYFGLLRLSEMIVEVATAVGVVLFSHGVRSASDVAAARDSVRVARLVLAVMAVCAALLALVAGPFLRVMLGAEFAPHVTAFRILLAAAIPACLTMMLFPSLTARGHARFGAIVFGPGVAANGLLTWWLAPSGGVAGAALAVLAANLLVAVILMLLFRRQIGTGLREMILPSLEDLGEIRAMAMRRLRRGRSPLVQAGPG
ncbi:MAG: polysaccharide biosynthesis C-terminal domain-containing protein [Geminicoccaceae bacterium]